MMPAAATSRDQSETLFATPAIVADRRADGSIILKSTDAAAARRALRRRLAGALGAADAGPDLSRRPRQRRCAVDDGHLQGRVAAGALGGRVDSRAGPERRASAGDPVRQQRRARAVRARGPACRRALGRDLAGLFADVQRFRQAQEHGQRCWSPARSMSPAQNRSRRRWRRSSRCIRPAIVSGNADDADAISFRSIAATPETPDVAKAFAAIDAGHDRKIPVHLGLDRHAEGRHQHPAHADLEPAGQGADLDVPRR